jgi:hypothetical protein
MLKTTLTLAAVSLTLLLSTSVFAQSIRYLGAHTVVDGADPFDFVQGGLGVLQYNRRCAAAFDGAQMCESIDLLRSGSLPDDAAKAVNILQWIKPTIVQVFVDPNDITVNRMFDVSGVTANFPGGLSCLGWSTSSNNNLGLIVSGDGQFGARSCNAAGGFGAVACCKVSSGKK